MLIRYLPNAFPREGKNQPAISAKIQLLYPDSAGTDVIPDNDQQPTLAKTKDVLILEDDALMAQILMHHLRDLGYSTFRIVSNSEEAISQAFRIAPDLVIADIRLGPSGEDGTIAAQLIHAQLAVPLVFVSVEPHLAAHYKMAPALDKALLNRVTLAEAISKAKNMWILN